MKELITEVKPINEEVSINVKINQGFKVSQWERKPTKMYSFFNTNLKEAVKKIEEEYLIYFGIDEQNNKLKINKIEKNNQQLNLNDEIIFSKILIFTSQWTKTHLDYFEYFFSNFFLNHAVYQNIICETINTQPPIYGCEQSILKHFAAIERLLLSEGFNLYEFSLQPSLSTGFKHFVNSSEIITPKAFEKFTKQCHEVIENRSRKLPLSEIFRHEDVTDSIFDPAHDFVSEKIYEGKLKKPENQKNFISYEPEKVFQQKECFGEKETSKKESQKCGLTNCCNETLKLSYNPAKLLIQKDHQRKIPLMLNEWSAIYFPENSTHDSLMLKPGTILKHNFFDPNKYPHSVELINRYNNWFINNRHLLNRINEVDYRLTTPVYLSPSFAASLIKGHFSKAGGELWKTPQNETLKDIKYKMQRRAEKTAN